MESGGVVLLFLFYYVFLIDRFTQKIAINRFLVHLQFLVARYPTT